MSHTSGFTTLTRVQAVSLHRTTTSPTCRKDSSIGATQAFVNAVCVDHSWTLNSSKVNPAAPLKSLEGITLAADPGATTEARGLTEAH